MKSVPREDHTELPWIQLLARKIRYLFLRRWIWNNAWSKNQTRSQNFEIQASNSLSNLVGLALFKSTSNWHQFWWSLWTSNCCRASEAQEDAGCGCCDAPKITHGVTTKACRWVQGKKTCKDVWQRMRQAVHTGKFWPPALKYFASKEECDRGVDELWQKLPVCM